jgi:hypothetical protein
MIIGAHNKTGFVQFENKMEITAGMFPQPVNKLHDGTGFADRSVLPGFNRVPSVVRGKTQFFYRHDRPPLITHLYLSFRRICRIVKRTAPVRLLHNLRTNCRSLPGIQEATYLEICQYIICAAAIPMTLDRRMAVI